MTIDFDPPTMDKLPSKQDIHCSGSESDLFPHKHFTVPLACCHCDSNLHSLLFSNYNGKQLNIPSTILFLWLRSLANSYRNKRDREGVEMNRGVAGRGSLTVPFRGGVEFYRNDLQPVPGRHAGAIEETLPTYYSSLTET